MTSELPPTPECDKMQKVTEESNKIGEFLDWLQHSKKIVLAEWPRPPVVGEDEADEEFTETLMPFHFSMEQLLAEYYKIDLNKVEQERRMILEHIRSQNKK